MRRRWRGRDRTPTFVYHDRGGNKVYRPKWWVDLWHVTRHPMLP